MSKNIVVHVAIIILVVAGTVFAGAYLITRDVPKISVGIRTEIRAEFAGIHADLRSVRGDLREIRGEIQAMTADIKEMTRNLKEVNARIRGHQHGHSH